MIIGGFQKFSLIDYPGKISSIIFTRGCNFACAYCHNKELIGSGSNNINMSNPLNPLPSNSTITSEEVLSFLQQRRGKIDAVVITGGEPTLQPDLIEFMKKIKKLGFLIKLDSNGSRPEVLKAAMKAKVVDYIAMDIKAPLEKYSVITKKEVDIKKIQESIDLIKNSNIRHEFRTTVLKALLSKQDIMEIRNLVFGSRLFLQKYISSKGLEKELGRQENYKDEEFLQFEENFRNQGCECSVR